MMFASMIEIVIMPRFGTGANACPFIGHPPRNGIIQGRVMLVVIPTFYSRSLDLVLGEALLASGVRLFVVRELSTEALPAGLPHPRYSCHPEPARAVSREPGTASPGLSLEDTSPPSSADAA